MHTDVLKNSKTEPKVTAQFFFQNTIEDFCVQF